MNTRMDRRKMHIGTYCLRPNARTERHIRELAECGIDFLIGVERDEKLLGLLERYGVGAVVNRVVPGWFGGNGDNAGTMAQKNPLAAYEAAAEGFLDHPAIWGIDVGDEPSCLDFPHYGRAVALVERSFPNQFAYLNLYANYGMVASGGSEQAARELGTDDYTHYLESYCRCVPGDYLCFDHYMFTTDYSRLLENLRTAADVAEAHGRDLWIVLQVNSIDPKVYLSEEQLYLQAYAAMAFGVRCISWACYTPGWWHNHVLDSSGEKTEQYEKLKRVNRSVLGLSEVYMRYRREETLLLNAGEECRAGECCRLRVEAGKQVLVSRMSDGADRALFLAAGPEGEAKLVVFTDGPLRFRRGEWEVSLQANSAGMVEITVPCCGGGILTWE